MKYIFLDIDGTLFDHREYAIPESAYRAVDLTRKAGNKVFICTGRSCCLLGHVKDMVCDGVVFLMFWKGKKAFICMLR